MEAVEVSFGEAVALEWADSKSGMGWEYKPETIGEVGTIKSIGFVVRSSPKSLAISTSINPHGAVIDPLIIPWACVSTLDRVGPDWDR